MFRNSVGITQTLLCYCSFDVFVLFLFYVLIIICYNLYSLWLPSPYPLITILVAEDGCLILLHRFEEMKLFRWAFF